jgi:hypothetical protein
MQGSQLSASTQEDMRDFPALYLKGPTDALDRFLIHLEYPLTVDLATLKEIDMASSTTLSQEDKRPSARHVVSKMLQNSQHNAFHF